MFSISLRIKWDESTIFFLQEVLEKLEKLFYMDLQGIHYFKQSFAQHLRDRLLRKKGPCRKKPEFSSNCCSCYY